jgi:hypothetical protein
MPKIQIQKILVAIAAVVIAVIVLAVALMPGPAPPAPQGTATGEVKVYVTGKPASSSATGQVSLEVVPKG